MTNVFPMKGFPKIPDDIIIRIPDLVLHPEILFPIPVDPFPPLPPFPDPIPLPISRNKNQFFSGTNFERLGESVLPKDRKALSMEISRQPLLADQEIRLFSLWPFHY